jgi:hypothetical protein
LYLNMWKILRIQSGARVVLDTQAKNNERFS